jgi:hypothetical protein
MSAFCAAGGGLVEGKQETSIESKNEEPACGGRPGVYDSESKKTEPEIPSLSNVKPEDLWDPARLLDLHAQAVAAGYISPSEAERLNFFAAANHARVIGSRNPPGLFVRIVRSGLWSFLTQDDEERARVQLRCALYPDPPPRGNCRVARLLGRLVAACQMTPVSCGT